MKKKDALFFGSAIILVVIIIIIVLYNPPEEDSYPRYDDDLFDSRLYGSWVNISTNESPEFPLSWYTFQPNNTCYSPMGKMYWYVEIAHYKNHTSRTLMQHVFQGYNTTFTDIYHYSFSDNNKTLRLNRTLFSYVGGSNWKFTNRTYYKLNEVLNIESVLQNSEHYLATFSINDSRWYGVNITVEGYYNSSTKTLASSPMEPLYSLNIDVDNFSLLNDGIKYYFKGILRDYLETPLVGDYILDINRIIEI